ncbi:MAG: DEAD/DEAH box helicase [Candidatus Omnitrophota bacterium]|nr:DEAD/DEAH box helicase [Candidatus Omnitrophota bacterium]
MQYDRFQEEAIGYINQGFSVIVSAPTGAGKTAIAEHVIEDSIKKNEGVIYTAPIKTLSNQKFRDFQAQFGEKIGILTGDVTINQYAPVLIMTTEIFRNKTIEEPDTLKAYSWVIFDEVHYIDNHERGTVWEESLIFLPKHIKTLCLSATIPNIEEFAAWLSALCDTPVKVVKEDKRPVPLHFFFQCQNEIFDNVHKIKFPEYTSLQYHQRGRHFRHRISLKPNRLNALINHIRQAKNLPLIYFVFGRRRAEDLASELITYNFLNDQEKNEILALFDALCKRFELTHERSAAELYPLIQRGIAYHHAGMLPTLKEVIEQLFTSRLLKVIFTTETFALGINMPARSVIFDDLRKFYGDSIRPLKTRDFFQMAGRAGRRGMDKEGFVYLRINPYNISYGEIKRIVYGKPESIYSQLNNSYATILNLYDKYRENIFEVYRLSFHHYQSNQHSQKEAQNLMLAKINLLKELGHISEESLSDKGNFAKSVYGYELILSELYEEGFLEELDETSLGILSCAVIFEPRKNQEILSLSKKAKEIKKKCETAIEQIRHKEMSCRIHPLSKKPYFHLSSSIEAWIEGQSFNKIVSLCDVDEGELVRYFRMSLQILREINSSPASSPFLKERARNVIARIKRDIVDAEKQLRE